MKQDKGKAFHKLLKTQIVDFGAPPQTWEQYSKERWIYNLYIVTR